MALREGCQQLLPYRLGVSWVVKFHPEPMHRIAKAVQILRVLERSQHEVGVVLVKTGINNPSHFVVIREQHHLFALLLCFTNPMKTPSRVYR